MSDGVVRRITWRVSDVARVLGLVLVFVFAWQFFWMVTNAVFLGLLAVLLAIVLHEPARFLSRWMPYRVSFSLVVLVFLGGIVGLLIALIPEIVSQILLVSGELPRAIEAALAWLEGLPFVGADELRELPERFEDQLTDFVGRFVPLAVNIVAALMGTIAVIVLAIFLAAQPRVYRDLALRLTTPGSRDRMTRVYDETARNLRAWVIGKALTMVAVGIVTYIGLVLFKIPGALALATLAAVLEFIPNFGPILAATPAVIIAFLISPQTALWVMVFYIILQQIQSAVTVPLVERRAVNIPPAALLVWQLMLAIGFGFLALFVATPLLAVIAVAVRVLYLEPAEEMAERDRRDPNRTLTANHPEDIGIPPAPVADSPPEDAPPGEETPSPPDAASKQDFPG